MSTSRRFFFIAMCAAMLAAVWWQRHAESNEERAYLSKDGPIYRVDMKGWRFPLVHDPVSFLVGRTYQASFTMELPRIEGVIEGREIPVGSDKTRYSGQVVITNRTMKVDLYSSDRRPLSWNDEYTLVWTDTAGRR